ncbi:MAG: hypothetical protein IPJ00_22705, partial [Saprospirales bacterium]|nr:hypothetical protein [Saprospirales bacterium]
GLLKTTYGTDLAKLYMGDYSHGYFEKAIRVQSLLYAHTQDQAHLERIYQLMEDSKADVLREAVDRGRTLLSGSLPDSLLQRGRASLVHGGAPQLAPRRNNCPNRKRRSFASKYRTRLADLERAYEKVADAIKVQDPRFQGPRLEVAHRPERDHAAPGC